MAQMPEAALTALQFEIMQTVWDQPDGATIAQIRAASLRRSSILDARRCLIW